MDDAEKIRLKRLAKLGGNSTAPPASNATSASPPVQLKSQTVVSSSGGSTPMALDPPPPPPPSTSSKTSSVASLGKAPSQSSLSPEQWEHDSIQHILQVSFSTSTSQNRVHLKSLEQEFQEEKLVAQFTAEHLDRIVVARLTMEENAQEAYGFHAAYPQLPAANTLSLEEKSLVEYLFQSWKRAEDIKRSQNPQKNPERWEMLVKVQELCISYIGLLLQFPDMFPQPGSIQVLGASLLLPRLMVDPEQWNAIPDGFLEALVLRFSEDGLQEIFGPLLNGISADMRSKTITTNYMPALRAMVRMVSYKPLAHLITQLPSFNPPGLPTRSFEVASMLGPFFRLSTFGSDDLALAQAHFGNPYQRTRANVESAFTSLRLSLETIQEALYQLVMAIVKASPEAKEAILQWFASVLHMNEDRAKMHIADRTKISSEGFMSNILAVLLRLCDPIMDFGFTKIHLIDPEYFKSKRLDISKLTKLNATPEEEKEYFGDRASPSRSANFVTEIFFLTYAFQHYGLHRSILTYLDMLRELREAQKTMDQMKAEKDRWINTPRAALNEQMLKRLQDHLDKLIAMKLSFDIQLLDSKFLGHVLQFHQLSMRFLLRVATAPSLQKPLDDPNYAKGAQFKLETSLPLPEGPPLCFRMFPEYFVEDIAELVLQVTRFQPEVLLNVGGGMSSYLDEVLTFACIFLRSRSGANTAMLSSYAAADDASTTAEQERKDSRNAFIRNPYQISKWIEVLFSFTWDYGQGSSLDIAMKNVFGTHPIAVHHLAAGLVAHYVDVEKTGLSSQFYDKFGIRHNISQILKLLWNRFPEIYRDKIKQESVVRWDTFVKFVNLLMNDTTYLLDEGLSKLAGIHTVQMEMEDPSWNTLSDNDRAEKEKKLKDYERTAESCIQLANQTVHMLQYLTISIQDPFLRPEIIDRLAAMLNFNLVQLVGPKCTELKVRNPEKYGFKPKDLLRDIVDVYINLSSDPKRNEFVIAVARDGRSYNRKHFEKAASILLSKAVKTEGEVQMVLAFMERCESVLKQDLLEEEEMGDIPEEFLDPLMFTLMEDPVILPTSRITVDRSTIVSHLLSDNTDPFNRTPLTIDQVKPDEDIKAKIAAWKASKKKY